MSTAYYFRGQQFLDFTDDAIIKDGIKKEFGFAENLPLGDFYQKFSDTNPANKRTIDKLFFESILYSRLKNVYIDRMETTNIEVPIFKKRMENLITNVNKGKRPDLEDYMSTEGFYLMDALNITEIGLLFLAGFDFTETNDNKIDIARFLFFQVVPLKNGRTGYLIAAVELNFTSKLCLTLIRNNTSDIKKDFNSGDEDFEKNWEENLDKFYSMIKKIVLSDLGLNNQVESLENRDDVLHNYYFKKDRAAMYNMCQSLDEQILKEFREELDKRVGTTSTTVTNELMRKVIAVNYHKHTKLKDEFKQRLDSLLLSTLITTIADDEDIVAIAKEKQLIGFPTKISFRSNNSGNGSTGSSGKDSPISGMGMFHSLYIDFKEALELPFWSVSWFTDFNHVSSSDNNVVQTSIESNKSFFRIKFKNNNYLNKELIHHVVNNLSQYR